MPRAYGITNAAPYASAPAVGLRTGDTYWNTGEKVLYVYDGAVWVKAGTTILDGAGPPDAALGADGDYYVDSSADVLYGPKGGSQSAITGTGTAIEAVVATLGMQLKFLRAGSVTALRFYRVATDTTTTTRSIRIYPQGGGAALASATTTETPSTAGWVTTTLGTPLAVSANQEVRVAYDVPNVPRAENDGVPTSVAPDITILDGCYELSTGVYPGNGYPNNYWTDVMYEPTAWSIAVVGVEAGGATGTVLTKVSASDYDIAWQAPSGGGGGAAVHIGADAPSSPTVGQLWWRSDPDGELFIYYNDGTSSQFVPAVCGVGETGLQGPQGPQGNPGATGAQGPAGTGGLGGRISETLISQTTAFTTTEVTIYTKAITIARSGGILILATPCISLAASTTYTVTLRLKLDGATLTTLTPGAVQCTSNTIQMLMPTLNWFVPPPVTNAAHTITVTAQRDAATGTATYRAMSFTAVEIA